MGWSRVAVTMSSSSIIPRVRARSLRPETTLAAAKSLRTWIVMFSRTPSAG